ncbi:MAG: hypothetical protein RL126_346 [Actinomycetota bacterium]|jgi:hypothetical protein
MIFVPRSVKQLTSLSESEPDTEAVALSSLRSVPAWVLLGEPGAGKSHAFSKEAEESNGLLLTIADFVYGEIEDQWRDRCLFLDGLDEVRASGTNISILIQVKSKLRKLGLPYFRIACRAADWYGQSYQQEIVGASPNGKLRVYSLEPLHHTEIRQILENNFDRSDAEEFIEQAESHGISALLSNPQTLTLTVKALDGKAWPNSRNETYQLACEALIQEENRQHRNYTRFQPISKEILLDEAGHIFATLLLSDKSGVALDKSSKNDRYPVMDDLELNSPSQAALSLGTSLFVPSSSHEERLEPTHRSVAEYLAARWLGMQIDKYGLAHKRVFNLMLGIDGKAVAGLRGLYGWLALKSLKVRHWLIKNDPLTVILYSDLRHMEVEAKKLLLHEINVQTHANPSVLWDLRGAEDLSPLFQVELRDEYLEALLNTKRDDPTQTYVVFILKILKHSASHGQLTKELRDVAADDSRWERVRCHALEAWLESGVPDNQVLEFLDHLNRGTIPDPDEELTGILLSKIFSTVLSTHQALDYLHLPKSKMLGKYQYFWAYEFPRKLHEDDLPFVLDQLAQRSDLRSLNWMEFHISRMLADLITRGVLVHGDQISDLKLFTWLHIGANEYGERRHEPEFQKTIAEWLRDRPERYKGLLDICYKRNEVDSLPLNGLFNDSQVLRGIPAPADIGLWHFQKIEFTTNEILAKEHLAEAMRSLWSNRPTTGLTLEMVLEWASGDSIKTSWLEPLLIWEIPDSRNAQNHYIQQRQLNQSEVKNERSFKLAANISEIRAGTANPALMGELAGVWLNRYTDTRGETPLDRFKAYCDNYVDVYEACKSGLPACIKRSDLPTVKEIIELHLKQQAHWIRTACLLGMELIWSENPTEIDLMDSSTLEKMICFRLTDGTERPPEWFLHLVKNKPDLVSKILIVYAGASFKAKKEHVDGIYPLAGDTLYAPVARLSVPALIRSFPTRNKAGQLNQLNSLLGSALKYDLPELPAILASKLKLKSLDPGQRVYFLLTGVLIDPSQYESLLWEFVGQSWQRIQHISDFLGSQLSDLPTDSMLSAKMYGKLIEIQTPFAEIDWPMGVGPVSQAMKLGDHIKGIIGKLAALGKQESLEEISRLLTLPSLNKINRHLLSSKHEVIQKLRENSFSHPTMFDVVKVLSNKAPIGPADLQAILLDRLDVIVEDIQTSNSDLFRQFWTEGIEDKHKSENSCRDALLPMLRNHLDPLGIDCQPEADYVGDKRADIRVSYQNKYVIPVELKGEWNSELWTSIQSQLIPKYTRAKEAQGFGIYIVLWVGGSEQPTARDGGKRPVTRQELESRLHNYLSNDDQSRIAVRVIDVTRPVQ